MKIKIGGRWVGESEPCFIVAEAGSNHNGDLEIAKRLVDVAVKAGADAVKFQTFRAHALYSPKAGTIDAKRIGAPIYQALAKLEMPYSWIPALADYCRRQGIVFLSSPFDEESADLLAPYVPAFKVASYEISHIPLIKHIAAKNLPIILSTGTADLEEVAEAVNTIRQAGLREIVLLQCTAEYPAPIESLNLLALVTMRERFQLLTGLSDHSRDPVLAPTAAVTLGATIIEKHFTLSNSLPGPDHEFALEPDELATMVNRIRQTELALGTGIKQRQPVESKRTEFGRRCIFASQEIRPGDTFTKSNTAVLRCGELTAGLHPRYLDNILGTRAARQIAQGVPVYPQDVQESVTLSLAAGDLHGDVARGES
ncbi:MAG: N-acetylneuraminate synthase family protein [Chloroflexi bacterium]|nr:N-acetylneuraminate synthase family protein [Chloroflexota bacterium]